MSYINTSDKLNRDQLLVNMIFTTLDNIEAKTGVMAHETPDLAEKLKLWQDKKTKDLYFYNYLTKFFDKVNK